MFKFKFNRLLHSLKNIKMLINLLQETMMDPVGHDKVWKRRQMIQVISPNDMQIYSRLT